MIDSGFFQRVFRHHINRLAHIDFLEHSDSHVFRKDKWISAYLWLDTFGSILTRIRPLWTILSVVPSNKFSALCLHIMFTRVTVFLSYDTRVGRKSTALNLYFIIFIGFILVDLGTKSLAILISSLLFLEVTFCTEIRNWGTIFQ